MGKYLHEFLRYPDGTVTDNGWWKIVGDRLVNRAGGYHNYTPRPDDIIAEAENYGDLDHSSLLDASSPYGWLSQAGEFYGCASHDHSAVAELVLKSNDRELEENGFIKIYKDFPSGIGWFCTRGEPTGKQRDYLMTAGLWKED